MLYIAKVGVNYKGLYKEFFLKKMSMVGVIKLEVLLVQTTYVISIHVRERDCHSMSDGVL